MIGISQICIQHSTSFTYPSLPPFWATNVVLRRRLQAVEASYELHDHRLQAVEAAYELYGLQLSSYSTNHRAAIEKLGFRYIAGKRESGRGGGRKRGGREQGVISGRWQKLGLEGGKREEDRNLLETKCVTGRLTLHSGVGEG